MEDKLIALGSMLEAPITDRTQTLLLTSTKKKSYAIWNKEIA